MLEDGSIVVFCQGQNNSDQKQKPTDNLKMMNAPANPNKALWEKGDFTTSADTMRESGEALVRRME